MVETLLAIESCIHTLAHLRFAFVIVSTVVPAVYAAGASRAPVAIPRGCYLFLVSHELKANKRYK